jgi:hypothetical protein
MFEEVHVENFKRSAIGWYSGGSGNISVRMRHKFFGELDIRDGTDGGYIVEENGLPEAGGLG